MIKIKLKLTKKVFFIFFVITFVVLLEYFLKKKYISDNLKDPSINNLVIYGNSISPGPDKTFPFIFLNNEGFQIIAKAKTNNLGFFSSKDYFPNKENFNILVIGGEQTASSTVSVSWPDYLETIIDNPNVKVYNIGWPDARFNHYLEYYNKYKELLLPDLVIINYVETDYYAGVKLNNTNPTLYYEGRPVETYCTVFYNIEGKTALLHALYFSKKKLQTVKYNGQNRKKCDLTDPNTVVSRPYGVFVNEEFIDHKAFLKKIHKNILNDMVSGALKKYDSFLLNHLSFKVKSVHEIRNFDINKNTGGPQIEKNVLIDTGKKNIKKIIDSIPNLLIVKSFSMTEFKKKIIPHISESIKLSNKEFDYIDSRLFFSGEDISGSFYPEMTEKFNKEGMKKYAEAVHKILVDKGYTK